MKFFVVISFLILSGVSQANVLKKYKMSDLNFYRYAQPQLKNLTSDFYHVLKKLNPNHAEFINIQKSLVQHIHQLNKCKNLKYCAAIDRVARDLNQYEKSLWKLQKGLINMVPDPKKLSFDRVLEAAELARSMQEMVLRLKTKVDTYFAFNKNGNDAQIKHVISQNLKLILFKAQEGATCLIDERYRKDFSFINDNFIAAIEKHILIDNNKLFLLSRFRELDNSWNSFNLIVEREIQDFPKESLSLIIVMHNRWNSVLKIILRRG